LFVEKIAFSILKIILIPFALSVHHSFKRRWELVERFEPILTDDYFLSKANKENAKD